MKVYCILKAIIERTKSLILIEDYMGQEEFKAFIVEEKNETFIRGIKTRLVSDLPDGDLLIKVHYLSLNYKDALSAIGNIGVTRKYPHTPGIDAVGTVISSNTKKFEAQD
jgi:NADPH:quinone reductase-like Zn-dependent oxidoreductase